MRIVFFGAPGVGKGTFAKMLSKKENLKHINVGNILRMEINNNTTTGKEVKEFIRQGCLVPDSYIVKIVKKEIETCLNKNINIDMNAKRYNEKNSKTNTDTTQQIYYKGFLLDGFPRNLDQSKELVKLTNIDLFIYIYLPKNILIQKLLGRRLCKICDQNFNVAYIKEKQYDMPPLLPSSDCNICKGNVELIKRIDDTEEIIHHRLQQYESSYLQIHNFFKNKNYAFIEFELEKGIKDFDRLYNIIKKHFIQRKHI